MLKSLYIKNYALLDEIQVDFGRGLNVITGETGAGKSIIIDALGTILGDKTDADTIRSGADKAVVEGQFGLNGLDQVAVYLQAAELDEGQDDLILRREVHSSGRSRAFVNDVPVPMRVLIEIGDLLVDLHGQHAHQSLLRVREHLTYLDAYGQLEHLADEVGCQYGKVQQGRRTLVELQEKEAALQEKRSLYEVQLREIESVAPEPGEEEKLKKEERLLQNSEKLFEATGNLYQNLYEGDGSVVDKLHRAAELLSELAAIDDSFIALGEMCQSAQIATDEMAKTIQAYRSQVEFSPERLEQIRERLARLSGLKKRHGGSLDAVLEHRDHLRSELSVLGNLDEEIQNTERRLAEDRNRLSDLCLELSERRGHASAGLERRIVEELSHLGMPAARFSVVIERTSDDAGPVVNGDMRYRATSRGIDNVEFHISTNPGEDLRQLAKVASGGEISRIMLALKSALAKSDRIPVLIFDEIDIGISGRIAQVVGRSLKDLAETHQVICITHLPQIASMGHRHYLVEKRTEATRTHTGVRRLSVDERPAEIAKLLGGEKITEAHVRGARQLLEEAKSVATVR